MLMSDYQEKLLKLQTQEEQRLFHLQDDERQESLIKAYAYNKEANEREQEGSWASCGAYEKLRNRSGFDMFRCVDDSQLIIREKCELFLKSVLDGNFQNLVLIGKAGVGKTFFSLSILKAFCQTEKPRVMIEKEYASGTYGTPSYQLHKVKVWIGVPVYKRGVFVKSTDLVDECCTKTFGKTDREAFRFYADAELLVIDEVGKNALQERQEQSILFKLLDARTDSMLPTIITSNLSVEDFNNYLGDATVSRINSNCMILDINSLPDMRNPAYRRA